MTSTIFGLSSGALISDQGQTVDGYAPVTIGTLSELGSGSANATLIGTLYITGIDQFDEGGGGIVSAIIQVSARRNASGVWNIVSRTDTIPIRTGSSLYLQNCIVSITGGAELKIKVTGIADTIIDWSCYMFGSALEAE